jgi:glutamate-ammonia-ligase adenylyltransferase
VTPFVYRQYLDYGVFESLREMQALIAAEVTRRDMADNIKLGPGGIREIEFIVQSLQLVRGGSRPELQSCELLTVLPRLVGRHGLSQDEADNLSSAYRFLRRIENFIQAIRDQQTHDLPTDVLDRERLRVAMGYPNWDDLLAELNRHRNIVTRQFETIALRERQDDSSDAERQQLATMWDNDVSADEWARYLKEEGYPEAAEVAGSIAAFAGTTAARQIDETGRRRLREFMAGLLQLVKTSNEPAVALHRAFAVVEKILRRSAYLALLNENAHVMARLVRLCERSAYIAQQIARYPVLLDELLDPRLYTARISRNELEMELRDRIAAAQAGDSETQMAVLGQFQRASLFRIAVADFNGNLPVMRVSDALTDLAETVLEYALSIAWHDMTAKHGEPEYEIDGDKRRAGFGIVAYGKMGGIELSYRSDLDLVFLHDSHGTAQQTNGAKSLDNTMFYARLVRRLVHFLTTQTGSGALYQIDMRLRPDGQSGLLVTSTEAFERYQEENAWTWEHQALLRARPVAGSAAVAREFERIRAETLTRRVRLSALRDDVVSMRQRMRKELDKSDATQFDLKQGNGGIGDIEFIVQFLVLANAHDRRSVIHYPDNIRQLATLAAAGCLDADEALRLQDIYRAYRLRLHHLTLDEKQLLLPAKEFTAERADVRRIWEKHLGSRLA